MDLLRRAIDLMAKSGLMLRGDPPKVVNLEGREWGPVDDGLSLSIQAFEREGVHLSVILRNDGGRTRVLSSPGWVNFFALNVVRADGSTVELTRFGQASHQAKNNVTQTELAAGSPLEIELPLGLLFNVNPPGAYLVRAECLIDEHRITSNQLAILR